MKVYDDIKHLETIQYLLEDTRYKSITVYTSTFLEYLLQQVRKEIEGLKEIKKGIDS